MRETSVVRDYVVRARIDALKHDKDMLISEFMGKCELINDQIRELNGLKPKQTNADRIRSMSDEELAEFIRQVAHDCYNSVEVKDTLYYAVWDDKGTTLAWLRKRGEEQ